MIRFGFALTYPKSKPNLFNFGSIFCFDFSLNRYDLIVQFSDSRQLF